MPAGAQALASLTGNEAVIVDPATSGTTGAVLASATTGQIAGLATGGGVTTGITNTNITTVGNGTLTAAGLVGGLINRSGPTGAFTDTTDSAANIITAIGGFHSGATFFSRIKNGNAQVMTLSAGSGVTLPTTNVVGPFQEAWFYGTVGGTSGSPTVTFTHMLTASIGEAINITNPIITALATNGAGTITAAMINGGIVNRTTVAAAFTDTTDTAAAIIANNPALVGKIGESFTFIYANNSTGVATLTGGTGVTVSGITTCPPGVAAEYLITYTATATITMVGLASSEISPNNLIIGGATSGQVTLTAPATAGAAALVLPPNAAGTIQSTTGTNLALTDIYRSTSTSLTNNTPVAITGLSGVVAVGTYRLRAALPTTANGTSGLAVSFVLTTAVLGAINSTAVSTASGVASVVQYVTTTTSATNLFANTAASLLVVIEATFTVTTAGTFALFAALNTGSTSAVIQTGGYMELTRIA